jgi:hypothetical protein
MTSSTDRARAPPRLSSEGHEAVRSVEWLAITMSTTPFGRESRRALCRFLLVVAGEVPNTSCYDPLAARLTAGPSGVSPSRM